MLREIHPGYHAEIISTARDLWRKLPQPFRLRFWTLVYGAVPYQKIVYRGRTLAWGVDRTAAYRSVFPCPPVGKTILDVGCNAGAYCFMAAGEGARHCVGIDNTPAHTARGLAALRRLGIDNLEIVTADAFHYKGNRAFDIVLCLNVLQHLGTIEKVDILVDRLFRMAGEQLILICPLVDAPSSVFEYAVRGKRPYVLLSSQYFHNKYGDAVYFTPLEPRLYGPQRGLIILRKHAQ